MKTCPVCQCEQAEGLLCHNDTTALERELGDVTAIVGELDVTISKQAKIGNASGPGGLARERTPVNWGAAAVLDDLTNTLTTWARDVLPKWGLRAYGRPALVAARILLSEVDTIRRHPAVEALVDEITDAITQARRAVDRPADKVYLGQCLMVTPDQDGRDVTCLEEVWARPGASETTCKVCGVTHEVSERRAWLLKKCEDYLFTVKDASQMMGEVGHITVTQASIRGYIHRGKIGYRAGNMIRLGDLMAVVLDEGERKSA